MKMVILSSNFPFGTNGDNVFIKNEIFSLASKIDEITVVSTGSDYVSLSLPTNVYYRRVAINRIKLIPMIKSFFGFFGGLIKTYKETKSYCKEQSFFAIAKEIFKYEYVYNCMMKVLSQEMIDADLIYSYWMSSRLYSAIKLSRKMHLLTKIITRAHGYDLYCNRGPLPYRTYIGNNISEIVFISNNGQQYYKKTIYNDLKNKCRLSVYYLGVNRNSVIKDFKHNYLHITTCSSVIKLKRLDIVIDAISRINEFEVKWSHIGDGPLLEQIKDLARAKLSNKKNVAFEFLGNIDNQDVVNFYNDNEIDLFVNASDTEGLPVSIMEAFSFGIPVVCRDVGGCAEINKLGKNFLLNKEASGEDFSSALKSYFFLLDNEKKEVRKKAADIFDSDFSSSSIDRFTNHIKLAMDKGN